MFHDEDGLNSRQEIIRVGCCASPIEAAFIGRGIVSRRAESGKFGYLWGIHLSDIN
jgi:hypothetical protein